jgi:hypothetical protein
MPRLASCDDELVGDAAADPQGEKADPCRRGERSGPTRVAETVAIVRSPGIIGRALEEAVRTILLNQTEPTEAEEGEGGGESGGQARLVVVPTSSVAFLGAASEARRVRGTSGSEGRQPDLRYTRIVRIATQPLLLDAIDAALEASEPSHGIAPEEALCVARMLVRWHCHHNAMADAAPGDREAPPLLTITAQSILSRPADARKRLAEFVGRRAVSHQPGEAAAAGAHLWMDGVAHRVLGRIDECTAAAEGLLRQQRAKGIGDWEGSVRDAVRREAEDCAADGGLPKKNRGVPSGCERLSASGRRVLEVAEALLASDGDSASLCARYPSVGYCRGQEWNRPSPEVSPA